MRVGDDVSETQCRVFDIQYDACGGVCRCDGLYVVRVRWEMLCECVSDGV